MNASISPAIAEELFGLLNNGGKLKKSWAVRSSAVAEDSVKASFAGIHDSFLNVCGLEEILSAVKGCYASLRSPRAVAYRKKMNINDDEATMAVVVIEMVEAQAAGVGFTCDIQSGRQNVMMINASFGLGESVVNGIIEPDTYYLEFETLNFEVKLIQRKIGSKQGMTVLNEEGGTEGITSAEHGYRLVELDEIARKDVDAAKYLNKSSFDSSGWSELPESSPFKKAFCEFIKEYGHRTVYELDIINPRWNEDQTYLLGIIQSTMNIADIRKLKKEQKEKREQVWLEIEDKVPDSERTFIRNLVKECQIGAGVRERTKSVLAEVMEAYRL